MAPTTIEKIRHSLAHLLAAAVLKKYPETKLGIGPVIENGFYYDFLFSKPISPEDLPELEKEIRTLIKASLDFKVEKITPLKAKKLFSAKGGSLPAGRHGASGGKDQPLKLDLIKEFSADKKPLTIYRTGDVFTDLCEGGHVKNTSAINPEAFKLTHLAGAYWRGNEKNPMLTRIYGVAFNTKNELDAYLTTTEEAKKRDHKKLGLELDLFVFSDLVGNGLPLFTPRGAIIRKELEDFVQSLQIPLGYQRVHIPHITKKELYVTSGHWQKFREEIFRVTSREGHELALKPMNCPHHTQIYASRKRSYRELPIRYSEVTAVYRDEQSGELSGLSRIRAITQDDAHVFCRFSQIEEETFKIWDMIDKFYAPFKMPLTIRFSRHNPKQFEKYLGAPKIWKTAEEQLRKIIQKRGEKFIDGLGEAALYGPKIDFIANDSLGRQWQLATIQLDFNLPERFNLACVNEKGGDERVVMIHRAILGSVERFMAVLIEHYAGAFPTWLAPVQAIILPISEKHREYAEKVKNLLSENNIRVEIDGANETLGKRIRAAELQKIPYILITGDKEKESTTVSVRRYKKGDLGAKEIQKFIEEIKSEIAARN